MSIKAELVWTAELQRRYDVHMAEVRRRLARRQGETVQLRYDQDQVGVAAAWGGWGRVGGANGLGVGAATTRRKSSNSGAGGWQLEAVSRDCHVLRRRKR